MCFAIQAKEEWDGELLLFSSIGGYGNSMILALCEASAKGASRDIL